MDQFEAAEINVLLQRVFDGPDLGTAWLQDARPPALRGETPNEAIANGRGERVVEVLRFLSMGA